VPSGVPGTASNIPPKDAKPPANVSTQTSKSESAQYGVNKTVVHTVTPAGRVQRITAAILVDDEIVPNVQKGKVTYTHRKRSPQELTQIKELAQAVIGFDEKRGDTISVQNLSFDADSVDLEGPAPAAWTTQVQKAVSEYSPALRPVSLLVLFILAYLFVLRPVQKHALSAAPAGTEPLLTAGQVETMPGVTAEFGGGTVRAAQLKQETVELIKQKPVHTARALQAWMREEPS
jgi:flagellar M-ring protein FliF